MKKLLKIRQMNIKKNIKILSSLFVLILFGCKNNFSNENIFVDQKNHDTIIISNVTKDSIKFLHGGQSYYYIKKNEGYFQDFDPVVNDDIIDMRLVLSLKDTFYTYKKDMFLIDDSISIKRINKKLFCSILHNNRLNIVVKTYYDTNYKINRLDVISDYDSISYVK